jgi:prepilin-type N-terminal cleavage/methylation domain-containing protein
MQHSSPTTILSGKRRGAAVRDRGFTLIELLIVIGIIAVLISILLPALSLARQSAINTQCAARIHEILLACDVYLNDYKTYPTNFINDNFSMVFPQDQQSRTLNQIVPYLGNYQPITNATLPSGLPSPLVCPFVDGSDDLGREWTTNGNTYWYTGYGYFAKLLDKPNYVDSTGTAHYNLNGVMPIPSAGADDQGSVRAALWGDAVVWFGGTNCWYYTHTKGRYAGNASYVFYHNTPTAFGGQNMGYTDGSVEFNSTVDFNPGDWTKTVAYYENGSNYWWWF